MAPARQYCITCPRSDWQAIRSLAADAGMTVSAFILREVLGGDCRLALTAEEQRALHDRTLRLASLAEELAGPLPGSGVTMAEALAFLAGELRSRPRKAAAGKRGGRPRPDAGRGAPDLFGDGPQ